MWTLAASYLVFWAGFVCAALLLVHVIRQRHTPAGTSAWLLLIILLPYIGVPLYLLFGGRKLQRIIRTKSAIHLVEEHVVPPEQCHRIDRMLRRYGIPGATEGNTVRLCTDAVTAYSQLINLINESKHHIHIATYVLANDLVGKEIIELLAKRAAEGVEVRVLLDRFGSFMLRRKTLVPLLEAGGQVESFMPMLRMPFTGRTNLRNHRKIAIFDSIKVWAGGANIGKEYIGKQTTTDQWKDISFVIEGPSVRLYSEIFRSDWGFASGKKLSDSYSRSPAVENGGAVQIVPSGPDIEGDPLYHAILSAAFTAQSSLWIVTPYFVPEVVLIQALIIAARNGVDVTVIIPHRSNHLLADLARGTYLRELKQNGIRVLFHPVMLHAKAVLMDQELAIVGSANIDIRSLLYNFEVGAFLYDKATIVRIKEWLEVIAEESNEPTLKAGVLRDTIESLVRLLSPVL